MIDFARITVIGGKGGNGAGSFLSIKGRKRGKADGGDGGLGGNVFMLTSRDLNTLEPFRYIKLYSAKPGDNGLSRKRKGAEGEDLIIKVPVGTLIKSKKINYDLVKEGEKVLISKGGKGGKGNIHLRDEYGRRPLSGGKGEEGEVNKIELELKLIADVGLIGLPNAGKSTLISTITAARPKVADYPFTTLEPNLGVLKLRTRSVVLADIPGLIEGASGGKGLGGLFLRHIERTRILVHLIDVSVEGNYWNIYQSIRNELRTYSKELVKKKEIIAINKIDLVEKKVWQDVVSEFKKKRKKVLAISASEATGTKELISEIEKIVS